MPDIVGVGFGHWKLIFVDKGGDVPGTLAVGEAM